MSVRILDDIEFNQLFSIAEDLRLVTSEDAEFWAAVACRENYRALNHRYSEAHEVQPMNYCHTQVNPVFFDCLIDVLEYQCDGLPDWEATPLYRLLNCFRIRQPEF